MSPAAPSDRKFESPTKRVLEQLRATKETDPVKGRKPFERDRDRLLYSDALRRLSGITQVARVSETYNYHTRLTHSIKVDQIARRLATYLTNSDEAKNIDYEIRPAAAGAAALAHDLGHPPFGHATEEELDHQIKQRGVKEGFEGNPQSFRIVTRNETSRLYVGFSHRLQKQEPDEIQGLNLTRRTLNAMIKYPWERGENVRGTTTDTTEKWGHYTEEKEHYEFARKEFEGHKKCPEAKIMDWADDVTYAIHDLLDFYKAGLIPLGEILAGDTPERKDFIEHFEKTHGDNHPEWEPQMFFKSLERTGLITRKLKKRYDGTREARGHLNNLESELIEKYLDVPRAVSLDTSGSNPTVKISDGDEAEVEFLKEMTFYYVIQNESLMNQQHGQRRIIKTLFNTLWEASLETNSDEYSNFNKNLIPHPYRNELLDEKKNNTSNIKVDHRLSDKERARRVADAITSLTERQTVTLYERISGDSMGSIQEDVI